MASLPGFGFVTRALGCAAHVLFAPDASGLAAGVFVASLTASQILTNASLSLAGLRQSSGLAGSFTA
jgi:hypothetical protein